MAIKLIREYVELGKTDGITPAGPNYRFTDEGVQVRYIVPGHFYTFAQLRPRGNDLLPSLDDWTAGLAKSKPYFDNWPIFLALDQYGLGINVKLMPSIPRRLFLRTYLRTLLPVLEGLVNDKGDFLDFEERIRQPLVAPFGTINRDWVKNQVLRQLPSIKYDFLIDKYNREEMRYLRLIDWPQVPRIGEVNYSTDPAVATRSQISDYLKNLT